MLYVFLLVYCILILGLNSMPETQLEYLNRRRRCSMSIIRLSDLKISQLLEYKMFWVMNYNIINSWIIVICPVINMFVFLWIFNMNTKLYIYMEIKWWGSWHVNHVVIRPIPIISNILLFNSIFSLSLD